MSKTKVALLGAGYIADWHAAAIKRSGCAEVVAVCDSSGPPAERLARGLGVPHFTSLEKLLANSDCQSVHILTPPGNHAVSARAVLEAGRSAFVEKPLTVSAAESASLAVLAREQGMRLGVNHNFLWLPAYERLRRATTDGTLGPIDNVVIQWQLPFGPLRSGPFNIWPLRETRNMFFETLPHCLAFAYDLLGDLEIVSADFSKRIVLPNGVVHFQGWTIMARSCQSSVTIVVSHAEGQETRTVSVRGPGGKAVLDFGSDTLAFERPSSSGVVVNPLVKELRLGGQHLAAGLANAFRQGRSAGALAPFGLSIARSVLGFHSDPSKAVDARHSPEVATRLLGAVERVAELAGQQMVRLPALQVASPMRRPANDLGSATTGAGSTVLVLGGTGYIGRHLVRRLADLGHKVRVFSRGQDTTFQAYRDRVSVVTGDLKSNAALDQAMDGVHTVFHLARADEKTWEGFVENDVKITEQIGRAAERAGVSRLVYTGTIASYDASDASVTITEDTALEPTIEQLSLYSRSKAACETALLGQHRTNGLPLVIVRPGIVVGADGPLAHWGVAKWSGVARCTLWGDGRNKLPFVLIEDVVDGLVRTMTTPGIDGQSFNLVGDPILSAREYLDGIAERCRFRIVQSSRPVWSHYAADVAKYAVKRVVRRSTKPMKPQRLDWASRAHMSRFDNAKSKRVLGWKPVVEPKVFLDAAIDPAQLLGFQAVGVAQGGLGSAAAPAVGVMMRKQLP